VKPLYPLFDGTSASKHEAGGIAKDGAKMVILRCKKRLTSDIRGGIIGIRIRVRIPNNMKLNSDSARISQTLVHGFRVLQAFTAPQPALTLVQVADRAGLDTATAFHLVQTLVVLGYIERISGTKQFRLTLKPLELGFHAIMQNPESFSSPRGVDKGSRELNSYSLSELLESYSLSEPLDKTK
jgi:hypothetical protein